MNNSQHLKWRMEQVWHQVGCVAPNHLARWSTYEKGQQCWCKTNQGMVVMLWFTKGAIRRPKGKRTHNGNEVPLRGTIWAFSMDRAQQFATKEEAQAALDCAKKFMKVSIYKKAVIKEV